MATSFAPTDIQGGAPLADMTGRLTDPMMFLFELTARALHGAAGHWEPFGLVGRDCPDPNNMGAVALGHLRTEPEGIVTDGS